MINKEFVPYEPSLELKELGFDEPCFGYYTGDKMHLVIRPLMLRANELESYVVTAPTFSQAFRWFREKYNLEGTTQRAEDWLWYKFHIYELYTDCKIMISAKLEFTTYEEAELACLKKLIEIVKNEL
jgi:hypothetical protein